MPPITLRPAVPEADFAHLAAWFTLIEDEPSTENGLIEYYQKAKERILAQVAVDAAGELLGFYWAARDRQVSDRTTFFLFTRPESRRQGVGGQLYEHMLQAVQAKTLQVRVWDNDPESLGYAGRRGFSERSHQVAMALDLDAFDDRPYDAIISRLQGEGFTFTSMEGLGDTEEAQRKLYALNDSTDRETMGASGEPNWESFEDFQKSVCQSEWYKPAGQKVVLEPASGEFVAMSAITRFEGVDYAYNLHTGVDKRYRNRQLGRAVKITALRFARQALDVHQVRTHHNTKNLPMLAIDRQLGYVLLPGTFLMEKILA